MIRVYKNFKKVPSHLAKGGKSYNHKDVKDALIAVYNRKCCFCEQKVEYFEVEHYRPRNAVKEVPTHSGYNWLKLEWSNLLYACKICNAGAGAKSTKFPILNERNRINKSSGIIADNIANSAFLLSEGALLLHPEIEDPEDHLTILSNGKLAVVDNSDKGKMTINICNLNRHSLWLEKRKATIDNICEDLVKKYKRGIDVIRDLRIQEDKDKEMVLMFLLEPIFERIKNNRKATEEFALLHRAFYNDFNQFVSNNNYMQEALPPNFIQIIQDAFFIYKKEG